MRRRLHLGVPHFRTPKTIRLEREYADLKVLQSESNILEMKAEGDPPDHYRFIFHGKSLVPSGGGDGVKIGNRQEVEVVLHNDFPRRQPQVNWLTPIVHPNISGSSVCMGNFAANCSPNIRLCDLVEVLWDYSRMAIFNPHSAYRGGKLWEDLDKEFHFPVDRRPLRDKVLPTDVGSSIVRPEGDAADIVIMDDDQGGCTFLE